MPPTLIAHRGYPARFPENTLVGYRAAVAAGARWLETDIQLSRDGHPVLYHDEDLRRTSNRPGLLADFRMNELAAYDAAECDRFGQTFKGEPIPRLRDFIEWLAAHDSVNVMLELKEESLDRFGIDNMVEQVLREIDRMIERCVVISFSLPAIDSTRQRSPVRTGWVLRSWDESHHQLAADFAPDFLIAEHSQLPSADLDLWCGHWQWVVYSIDDPDRACQPSLCRIDYVETNAIGEMMLDPRFSAN